MQEIFNENPEDEKVETQIETPESVIENKKAARKTRSWRQWIDTDEAMRKIYLIFGFFAILILIVWIQFSTDAVCCGDWDGYYHIRWSALLWENFSQFKWLPSFEWLPLTVLNPKDYADHHFLFHLLQIPFLWFFEPVTAAKVSAVVFATLAIFSVYWLLYRYEVDYLLIWLAALLGCANSFLFRMNMAKAPPLTIIYSVIGIYLLFERKYKWLLPLMFVFVWTYSLFPLLLIGALIWMLIIGWNERKFEWQPVAYTLGGMILGNVVNPYFPNNLLLFWEHFATKLAVAGNYAVAVGGEWYPYTGKELLLNFPVALLAMLIGYILFMPRGGGGKVPEKATFLLMFVTLLLLGQFNSKRYAEYFPPFAILFAAFSLRAFLTSKPQLPEDFQRDIEPYLDKGSVEEKQKIYGTLKQVGLWSLGILLGIWVFYNLHGIHIGKFQENGLLDTISANEPNDKYKRSMKWIQENVPEGERIFNCNWDNFPKMFFLDQKHTYVYGLDPNYLYSENPELYDLIKDITAGKTEDAAPIIREKFGSRFVFTDVKDNEDMVAKMLDSGWTEIAYEDDEVRILQIREVKGEPPKDETDAPPTAEELKQLDDEENASNAANVNADEDEDAPDEEDETEQ